MPAPPSGFTGTTWYEVVVNVSPSVAATSNVWLPAASLAPLKMARAESAGYRPRDGFGPLTSKPPSFRYGYVAAIGGFGTSVVANTAGTANGSATAHCSLSGMPV